MESVGRRALLLGASAAIALLVARRLWRSDVHQSHRGVGPLRLCWWALRTRRLRAALSETDGPSVDRACTVAGVDISFIKGSDTDACAGLVVLELSSLNVLYEDMERVTLTAPYVPGYLAFREVDFLLRLLDRLKKSRPHLVPDVILVDGNGKLHPHGCGLACHLGVRSGIPTIGIGKNLHHVDGLSRERLRRLFDSGECDKPGAHVLLVGDSGTVWGAALRTTAVEDFKPVLVSVGHAISLQSAIELTNRCCLHRIPEPVRQADLRSREWLRRHGTVQRR